MERKLWRGFELIRRRTNKNERNEVINHENVVDSCP